MAKKALVVLAQGFEEIEALTPVDVLRRAGVKVITAGVGSDTIKGGHDVTVKTDTVLEDFDEEVDVIILPGGMPGTENLKNSSKLKSLIMYMASKDRLIAAICAAPAMVLAPSGILNGKRATCFPGMETGFSPEVAFLEDKVVQDGNVITSRGAGTAFEFAFKIVETLVGKSQADTLRDQMVYS